MDDAISLNILDHEDSLPVAGLRRGSTAARLLGLRVKFRWGYGCPSLVTAVCCQVDVSAKDRFLVQRISTDRSV